MMHSLRPWMSYVLFGFDWSCGSREERVCKIKGICMSITPADRDRQFPGVRILY